MTPDPLTLLPSSRASSSLRDSHDGMCPCIMRLGHTPVRKCGFAPWYGGESAQHQQKVGRSCSRRGNSPRSQATHGRCEQSWSISVSPLEMSLGDALVHVVSLVQDPAKRWPKRTTPTTPSTITSSSNRMWPIPWLSSTSAINDLGERGGI